MPIPYKVKLNNGNENIGAEAKTITVQEIVKNATNKDIAREVYQLNPLIPEQVTLAVIENICQAAANLMSMGHAVTLQTRGRAALRIYPDIQLKGRNITIARAQQLDSTITDITEENAGDLVQRVGVRVRARAVCAPALTELIQAAGVSTQKTNIVNVPKILRANDNGTTPGTGGTTPSGENPNDGND